MISAFDKAYIERGYGRLSLFEYDLYTKLELEWRNTVNIFWKSF